MNGYPVGQGPKFDHKYECIECGRELAPDSDRKKLLKPLKKKKSNVYL
jgi:DNA-directed RNA polymerase subunit RPC12/RpoP